MDAWPRLAFWVTRVNAINQLYYRRVPLSVRVRGAARPASRTGAGSRRAAPVLPDARLPGRAPSGAAEPDSGLARLRAPSLPGWRSRSCSSTSSGRAACASTRRSELEAMTYPPPALDPPPARHPERAAIPHEPVHPAHPVGGRAAHGAARSRYRLLQDRLAWRLERPPSCWPSSASTPWSPG